MTDGWFTTRKLSQFFKDGGVADYETVGPLSTGDKPRTSRTSHGDSMKCYWQPQS